MARWTEDLTLDLAPGVNLGVVELLEGDGRGGVGGNVLTLS